jgi:hypothetical protein
MGNNRRFNEADNTIRSLSLLFVLFSPPKEIVDVFAKISAYVVFFCSTVLKLNTATAGILQLILLLNSNPNFTFDLLGIDNVAIWKIRAINSGMTLIGILVLLSYKSLPIFYYRIFRVEEPADTWIVSVCSNILVFVSFKLIILVQLQKNINNLKIIKMVKL